MDYLNARPLVHGLENRKDLFDLRFDPPSRCAVLLHEGSIDVGMIPAIEYCRGPEYRIVPGMAITSNRTVASVALFSKVPVERIRRIAADTSSRTSNALLRILCAERFGISPEFTPMAPDADAMLAEHDAALIIGDPALYLDPSAHGVEKIFYHSGHSGEINDGLSYLECALIADNGEPRKLYAAQSVLGTRRGGSVTCAE